MIARPPFQTPVF